MRAVALLLVCAWPAAALAGAVRGRVVAEASGSEGVPHLALWIEEPSATPRRAELGEKWLSFYPKVQVLPVGSTLAVTDEGDESHTVHAWRDGETLCNLASVPDGGARFLRLDEPGIVTLTCDIHRSMRAYVVVTPSAHATVSDVDGRFELDGVPPGHYPLRAWQPGDPTDGAVPGRVVAEVDVGAAPVALTLVLPPRPQAKVAKAGAGFVPDDAKPSPWTPEVMRRLHSWPRGAVPVLSLSAIALVLGLFGSVGNFRLGRRLGLARMVSVLLGCALAFASGLLVVVGLNGLVATALGFGFFTGTAVFGALEEK